MSTLPDFTGPGFFAGEAPDGLTTVAGTPLPAEVRVYWRDPEDAETEDVFVASTLSASNGTWRIDNINPELQYVVRGRKAGFDDVTVVGATPSRTDVIAVEDHLQPLEDLDGLDGFVLMDSGLTPFTATVIDPLPFGLSAVMDGRKLLISGTSDDYGSWQSTVRISAANAVSVDVPIAVDIVQPRDPHWANVVALLKLDGDVVDSKGRVWTNSGVAFDGLDKKFGSACANRSVSASSVYTPKTGSDFAWSAGPYTIEAFVKAPTASFVPPVAGRTDMICSTDDGRLAYDWGFGINERNKLVFAYWGGAAYLVEGVRLLNDGLWHHIAFCFDGTTIRIFADGVLEASDVRKGTPSSSAVAIRIGAGTGFAAHQFRIDEVRITKGVARYTSAFEPPVKEFAVA